MRPSNPFPLAPLAPERATGHPEAWHFILRAVLGTSNGTSFAVQRDVRNRITNVYNRAILGGCHPRKRTIS